MADNSAGIVLLHHHQEHSPCVLIAQVAAKKRSLPAAMNNQPQWLIYIAVAAIQNTAVTRSFLPCRLATLLIRPLQPH